MSLVKQESNPVYDLTLITRGTCVRVTKRGDTTARNGIVTEAKKGKITILYTNKQDTAVTYLDIPVSEVVAGLWEIRYTTDFETVYKEGGED